MKEETIKELKEIATAYQIALEFDYCPSPEEYWDAVDFFGSFDKKILEKHQGRKPYELALQLSYKALGR